MKFNDAVAQSVKNYAEKIVESVKKHNFNGQIHADYEPAQDLNNKEQAHVAIITSDIGVVIVFPDFGNKSAVASIFNVGLAAWMLEEGFTEKEVEADAKVYSKTLAFNEDNVETLGYYLSHKIDPSSHFNSEKTK